jgi:hypothetical protein
MGYDHTEYKLDVIEYKPDEIEEGEVSAFKRAVCGDNPFGNIFYPLWRNVRCNCCALWRGIVVGAILTTVAHGILHVVI